jgi:SAM-dependent methyltransferase
LALDTWLKGNNGRKRLRPAPSPAPGSALSRRPGQALPRIRLRAPRYGGRARASGPTRVLDIGTGTGVLAIAAARALRTQVVASDIDRCAVAVARANARSNAAGALVEVVHARGLDARRLRERGPFDLVFANILLPPLRRLAAPIARVLAPGARVILSGLLATQAPAAIAAYRGQGLQLEMTIPLDEWVTLMLARRGTRDGRRTTRRRLSLGGKNGNVSHHTWRG